MASPWMDETTLTTVKDLREKLGMQPTRVRRSQNLLRQDVQSHNKSTTTESNNIHPQHHCPHLIHEEEEILQHYKCWLHFNHHSFATNRSGAKEFYDMPDVLFFDFSTQIGRSNFNTHYDSIDSYYDDSHLACKDLEIVATSKESGYATCIQKFSGTGTDGKEFSFTYRMTSLLRKTEGGRWKWIHEHVSFPVDLGTGVADLTTNTGTVGNPNT